MQAFSATPKLSERPVSSPNDDRSLLEADLITNALSEWRSTVDAVADGIILEDSLGLLRRCNRATIDLFRCDYNDLIGKPLTDIVRILDDSSSEHLRKPVWEGQLENFAGWFEISNSPVQSDEQDGGGWVHIIKNVSGRRIREMELRKLYSVIEQSSDGILITDEKGIIEYINAAFEASADVSREQLKGEAVFEALPHLPSDRLTGEVFSHLEQNRFWRATSKLRRRDDTVFEELTVSKIVNRDGITDHYVFVMRDVTETRQLESIAEAVNLMENFGYVFSGIRHELGNPINSVKMALTVLEMNHEKWEDAKTGEFISRCLQEVGRVEYLLETLKSFSIHEQLEVKEVDLNRFVEKFYALIRPDFERRGVGITLNLSRPLRPISCNPRALHHVMMNLLVNAADALSDKKDGKITIATEEGRNRARISVSDNGRGMSEKQMSNLFKPFHTSKPDGSGLGLVIVKKMMVNMAGTVDIESEIGKGTKVDLRLPLATPLNESYG